MKTFSTSGKHMFSISIKSMNEKKSCRKCLSKYTHLLKCLEVGLKWKHYQQQYYTYTAVLDTGVAFMVNETSKKGNVKTMSVF